MYYYSLVSITGKTITPFSLQLLKLFSGLKHPVKWFKNKFISSIERLAFEIRTGHV